MPLFKPKILPGINKNPEAEASGLRIKQKQQTYGSTWLGVTVVPSVQTGLVPMVIVSV